LSPPGCYVGAAAAAAPFDLGQGLASSSSGTGCRKRCTETGIADSNWKS
jgi:hypothetical protein